MTLPRRRRKSAPGQMAGRSLAKSLFAKLLQVFLPSKVQKNFD